MSSSRTLNQKIEEKKELKEEKRAKKENIILSSEENVNYINSAPIEISQELTDIQYGEKTKRNKICLYLLNAYTSLSSFSLLSMSYFLKDNLSLSPVQMCFFSSLFIIPLLFKPLFTFMIQKITILGYRKKIYLFLIGLIEFIIWIILGTSNESSAISISLLFLTRFTMAISSHIAEAVEDELNNTNSTIGNFNKGKKFNKIVDILMLKFGGLLLSPIIRLIVVLYFKPKTVFLMMSILPLLILISGFIYQEGKISSDLNTYTKLSNEIEQSVQSQGDSPERSIIYIIKQEKVLVPLTYLLFLMSIPSYIETSFYYLIDYKEFTPSFFGILNLFISLFAVALMIANRFLIKILKIKIIVSIFLIFTFTFSILYNLWMYLGWKSKWILYFGISLYVSIKNSAWMPLLTLAPKLSPKGYEKTLINIFTLTSTIGRILSGIICSLMTKLFDIRNDNYKSFNLMVLIQNMLLIVPIIVILFIPTKFLEKSNDNKIYHQVTVKSNITVDHALRNMKHKTIDNQNEGSNKLEIVSDGPIKNSPKEVELEVSYEKENI